MSQQKAELIRNTIKAGLSAANRGNPFWTRSDAMQSLAINYNNSK